MINRLLYFGYYVRHLDWDRLRIFQIYLKSQRGYSSIRQWILIFYHSVKYNISILEYYQFRFFEMSHAQKLNWAGTGHMYEYQKVMNPPSKRQILDDKREFYKFYREFFVHHVFSLNELLQDPVLVNKILESQKLVFKVSNGKCGTSVRIISSAELGRNSFVSYMNKEGFDMVETFISQHPSLNALSPSAVNTVRIFTQLNNCNEVEILGCRQRISINSSVDNLAAGNLAAPIDESTGVITGPGVYSDITKEAVSIHPLTGVSIVGFQVPFWKECVQLATDAALKYKQNRSIGWDIVVTANGPGLIEGNHDWCKLVWQLPVNEGLKSMLKTSV
ncbi:MAG: hexapeptide transferase [Bacteroidetes bacterium]|jgi:hypothetical protein|nr:hexapeptide transferase [Bacteroidota bacterium]